MSDPIFTDPPEAPNRADPSTFSERAAGFVSWLTSFVSEVRELVTWINARHDQIKSAQEDVSTSASNALAFRNQAQGYAGNASTSAQNASDSATSASTSASNAGEKATTAGAAAQTAVEHANAAAASAASVAGAAVPVGTVIWYAWETPPIGYLPCNGAAISRSTYVTLFEAIGGVFGGGDGSTTFNLPDLRGEFIRGWDEGRGKDAGREFGSNQENQNQAHSHELEIARIYGSASEGISAKGMADGGTDPYYTSIEGGDEARPENVALLPCIKF